MSVVAISTSTARIQDLQIIKKAGIYRLYEDAVYTLQLKVGARCGRARVEIIGKDGKPLGPDVVANCTRVVLIQAGGLVTLEFSFRKLYNDLKIVVTYDSPNGDGGAYPATPTLGTVQARVLCSKSASIQKSPNLGLDAKLDDVEGLGPKTRRDIAKYTNPSVRTVRQFARLTDIQVREIRSQICKPRSRVSKRLIQVWEEAQLLFEAEGPAMMAPEMAPPEPCNHLHGQEDLLQIAPFACTDSPRDEAHPDPTFPPLQIEKDLSVMSDLLL